MVYNIQKIPFSLYLIIIKISFRWKEIETDAENRTVELPSPLWSAAANSPQDKELLAAGVDDYCKVDCDSQYYILIGFMFIAGKYNSNSINRQQVGAKISIVKVIGSILISGLIGASTRLPNTMLSLRTIDKRDKVIGFL